MPRSTFLPRSIPNDLDIVVYALYIPKAKQQGIKNHRLHIDDHIPWRIMLVGIILYTHFRRRVSICMADVIRDDIDRGLYCVNRTAYGAKERFGSPHRSRFLTWTTAHNISREMSGHRARRKERPALCRILYIWGVNASPRVRNVRKSIL